jgi:histidyl-tRNA synthetase
VGTKKQLKYADAKKIPFTILVMDESRSFVVKDMQRSTSDRSYRGDDCTTIDEAVNNLMLALKGACI